MSETATPTRAAKPARPRTFSCPNCGASIQVRANGISVTAICTSCGSSVDVASPQLQLIAQAQSQTRTLDIPIGTRGTLFGTEWEAIGYQQRRNTQGDSWEEYLLFNPYRGFRFLVHDDDGWSLFIMLRHDVQPPQQEDEPDRTQATTEYVLGEFYWRARAGDTAEVTQYQEHSRMLVCERTGDEIIWSRGVTLNTNDVRHAFGLQQALPVPQRETERAHTMRALRTALWALAALLFLSAIPFGKSRSLPVFQHSFTVSVSDRGRTIVTDPFEVPDAGGNLRIDIHAPVKNDWLELGLSLVQEPGGLTFNNRRTIEYYDGYDSDGYWSEGSTDGSLTFRSVPGGTYRLLIDPDAGVFAKAGSRQATGIPKSLLLQMGVTSGSIGAMPPPPPEPSVKFDVTVRRHVPAGEFFWLALLLLIPYPAYRLLFRRGSR